MKINLKSIKVFENLNDENISFIENSAEFYNYNIGHPILNLGLIPNKVFIILSGEARLIYTSSSGRETVSRLKSDSFIGLASLLNAKGCEQVTASSEVIVLAIPDTLENKFGSNLIVLFLYISIFWISVLLICPPHISLINKDALFNPTSIDNGSIPLSNLNFASVSRFNFFAVFLIDLGWK